MLQLESVIDSDGSSHPIENQQFDLVDTDKRFNISDIDRFQHGAEIAFDTEQNQIIVTGRLRSGSRSCRATTLDSASYNASNNTLTVVVLDTFNESAEYCTTEVAVVPYEAVVTFDSNIPVASL